MTKEEKMIAMRTSRSAGASAINKDGTIRAVVPLFVERDVDKNKSILDFGAGKMATSTKYLRSKGFEITAYDLWCEDGDELLDDKALNKKYDVVFASNVLNVQSSLQMLWETLTQIYEAVKHGGEFIANYPTSPRKYGLDAASMQTVIEDIFHMKAERVGGTKSAPIWKIKKVFN